MTALAFHVRLQKPVQGVTVHGDSGLDAQPISAGLAPEASMSPSGPAGAVSPELRAELEQEKARLRQTRQVLDDLIVKVTRSHEEMLTAHRQQIARLAVEIARKVLMQKVTEGDYKIEQIIQEALKNAPVQQDIVVHLHPEDLAACQSLQQGGEGPFGQLQLVGDPAVHKAECLLETPKGVVKSFIDNHLDKIREALERVN